MASIRQFAPRPTALLVAAAAVFLALPAGLASAATITVNTSADDDVDNGNCTLREAILAANSNVANDQCPAGSAGEDTIAFNIPGSGVATITPATELPSVTDPAIIDGLTQPGASAGNLKVELNGTSAGSASAGLTVTAGDSTVQGLVINRFGSHGLRLHTNGDNQVVGNYIGTDPTGTTDLGNGASGVFASSNNNPNAIGGATAASANVISGNAADGVLISDVGSELGSTVRGNVIGLTADGARDLGNDSDGVQAQANLGTVTIGGASAGEGNVISGNGDYGVYAVGFGAAHVIQGNIVGLEDDGATAAANDDGGMLVQGSGSRVGGTTGVTPGGSCTGACNVISGNANSGIHLAGSETVIQGNYVGTDSTGALDRGNVGSGISSSTTPGNVIGGTAPAARNVISGNGAVGIDLNDVGASGDAIRGNFIGVGADGSALGNASHGVLLGGDDNTVGGTASGAGNVIAHNGRSGVTVLDGGDDNSILANSIHANTELGIDLGIDEVTPNDDDDPDVGANDLQNFPVLTAAARSATATTASGTLNSTPGTTFRVELFSSPGCDPTGHGEGETFQGFASVTTNATGNASFSKSLPAVPLGHELTATATNSDGDTSELSACREVQPSLRITNKALSEGNAGTKAMRFTVRLSVASSEPVSVDYATVDGTAKAPGDYAAKSGTLAFDPGQTSKQISIAVKGDRRREPTERFKVKLSNPTGASIADGSGTGTIRNDD